MSSIARLDRFERVASTQDIVRGWLADGQAELCVAVADEQSAGRGRLDRSWQAPPGAAILLSIGFRPHALEPARAWRLGALVGSAMLDAVAALHGVAAAPLALKWPNDLVARRGDGIAKLGGVLGESVIDDGIVSAAIVGIGVNADWPAERFPAELAGSMSSLREVVGGPIDREAILATFLDRVVVAYDDLASGSFPAARWADRQVTTGARVELDLGDGHHEVGTAVGVDVESGGLLVRADDGAIGAHLSGDVVRCRLGSVGEDV